MKKMLVCLLAAALTVLPAAGCSGQGAGEGGAPSQDTGGSSAASGKTPSAAGDGEKMPVRHVLKKADAEGTAEVMAEVNRRLEEAGLPIEYQPVSVPQKVFEDRINMMVASGEAFEILSVSDNDVPFTAYLNNDYIIPIDDLLAQHGQDILKLYPNETDWSESRIGGKTYTVPAHWREVSQAGGESGVMGIRRDKLDAYGLERPDDLDALFDVCKAMKEKWGEKEAYLWPSSRAYASPPVKLLRAVDGYPFNVDMAMGIYMIREDGAVEGFYRSKEYAELARWMAKAYAAGLIHPDILTITGDEAEKLYAGRGLSLAGAGGYDVQGRLRENGTDPDYTYEQYFMKADIPSYVCMQTLNSNAISATSEHPEAGVMFLNWFYQSAENHDLVIYGIEGKHWDRAGNNRIERARNAAGDYVYDIPLWQMGHKAYRLFEATDPDEEVAIQTTPYEKVQYASSLGFKFDPTPVQAQYQAIVAEIPSTVMPISYGVQPYDQYFEQAIAKLDSIGYQEVIEEVARQYQAWKGAK